MKFENIPDIKDWSNEQIADFILEIMKQKKSYDLEDMITILIEKIRG